MPEKKHATRVEKDSLGHKEIPGHVYYGIQTARAVENFPISGLRAHRTLIRAIAHGERGGSHRPIANSA